MRSPKAHGSLGRQLRQLLWSMLLLVCAVIVSTLAILLLHNRQYSAVTANIVRASQFNQNFKEDVDLKDAGAGASGRHAGPPEPQGHHKRHRSV